MKLSLTGMMLLLLLIPVVATAATPEERGLAIAQEADRRDAGF